MARDELVRWCKQALEYLRRFQSVRSGGEAAQFGLFLQAGNPDFEKFIQVAADDAEVFQPLQQGHRGVFRLRQHAAVELEQTELAIEEILSREGFCHGRRCESAAC